MTIPLAGSSPERIQEALNIFGVSKFTELPEWAQQRAFSSDDSGFRTAIEALGKIRKEEMDPKRIEDLLRIQRESQAEQMKEASKYKFLFDIPKTISESFGKQATLNVLGARSIADAYNQALQAYPTPQFPSMSYQPQKYFS